MRLNQLIPTLISTRILPFLKIKIGLLLISGAIVLPGCIGGKNTNNQQADNTPQTNTNAQVSTTNNSSKPSIPFNQSAYSTDEHDIIHGKELFQSNCTACHNFEQKGIGPNLAGVTSRDSPEWLSKFVRNAPEVIKSGDVNAVKLYEEYKQMMPPFTAFTPEDVQSILAYLHTQQPASAVDENTAKLGPPLLDPIPTKIPKSELLLSLESFITAPATSDKIPLARINSMVVLPGKKNRVFVQDLRGKLYEMDGKNLRVYMDMVKERPGFIPTPGLATGFGSYAFHPEFYKNGLFYTTHTEKANTAPADFAYADSIKVALQWVLTEWKLPNPNAPVFAGQGRELLRVNMVNQIHGVQEITFNPFAKPGSPEYGLLYIGIGDGGAAEQKYSFLCNSNKTVWSTVLRIDPKGTNSKNGHYGIPAINPFAQDNDPETLGEVFATGFRNPNRIYWSPDGKMLISDIGLTNIEELNIGKAGANYGWPAREGTFLLNYQGKMDKVYALPADDSKYNYTYPVVQFDHGEGNAFSAGFVYTGNIPLLKNKYIFGDIVSGRVFFVDNNQLKLGQQAPIQEFIVQFDGTVSTFQAITGNKKTDLRFGVGLHNDLYLYTKTDGKMWRVNGCLPNKKI
ncbi:PQQ-dependent sugar dehydrogenase [Adhaeribacter radiodurans]|uniref:PQQ-dependent sugar dehydrogenase n=1 Tax=Adhaeribacter radiodurans TaxID=2745197 RepID=A0A7L7L5Z9_9BACT|nr:PQQ-dependent sugar dehydrogenase [Adhaeribacter radiodurans]QMU28247.1 PQQ-dependent sugar dehydrogenase [Adhaeribacter radiodurans]